MTNEVVNKLKEFDDLWSDSQFGPAHIVLADYNLEDTHINWCLKIIESAITKDSKYLPEDIDTCWMDMMKWYNDHSLDELIATKEFLNELLVIPEKDRILYEEDLTWN